MKVGGKFPIAILVGLAACTWIAVAVYGYGATVERSFVQPFSAVVAVVAAALAAFDRFLWKWPVICRFHKVPNLNGTWIGERASMWKDPVSGAVPPIGPVVMVIRQTFTSIVVLSYTSESSSMSVAAGLVPEADGGRVVVTYVFRNEPSLAVQDKSRIHYGGARLALGGNENTLSGGYWTDRDSKGTLTLKYMSKRHALDFEGGLAYTGTASS